MRIPGSASDELPIASENLPELNDAYIMNPYAGKEYLTLLEAYDLLSAVATELYADGQHRYGQA